MQCLAKSINNSRKKNHRLSITGLLGSLGEKAELGGTGWDGTGWDGRSEREGRCVRLGGSRCLPIFWHFEEFPVSVEKKPDRQSDGAVALGDSQKKEQVSGTDFTCTVLCTLLGVTEFRRLCRGMKKYD